jgi:hypothetical protein
MTKYKLASSSMLHAPGLVRWAINGYHFPKDRAHLRKVICETWAGVTDAAADALLSGAVGFTIEDETVIFEHEAVPA